MNKVLYVASILLFSMFMVTFQSHATDEDIFSAKVPPDTLLVLDLSGSMNWIPAGEFMYISGYYCGSETGYYGSSGTGHTWQCQIDAYGTVPKWSNTSCSGPFYISARTVSGVDYKTDCSRLAIAKRAIQDVLDDNNDGIVNTVDETNLGIRMGYMRFYNCFGDDTGGSYSSGCNTKIRDIKDLGTNNYYDIWSSVNAESAYGGTPLASALNEAKLYLDYSKSVDTLKDCRKKFAILVTDGSDTYACYGNGTEGQIDQYKRRRETVAKAKALSDAGYDLFVIGFGAGMPHFLRNTLNWAAYYGKTDNPNDANSGDTSGYNIPSGLYPSGISSCQSSSYTSHDLGDGLHYYATSNDPGEANIAGYAFIATDPAQLTAALKTIAKYIQEHSYSFTSPTIPSIQLVVGDTMYVSSFVPKNDTPFWTGNLKAYQLNADGTLPLGADGYPLAEKNIWHLGGKANIGAGEILEARTPDSRNILTYVRGSLRAFDQAHLTDNDLDLGADTVHCNAEPTSQCEKLISYVRGTDTYNIKSDTDKNWKLGDIVHSNTVIVGEPSRFFEDECFDKCSDGSRSFYQRYKDRTKVVIVGANDGILHAFNAATGDEVWAFIPNGLLQNLRSMKSNHTYYVDSSPKVADVWFDYDGNNRKSANEWRTVLVCGLRRGGKSYFALDITNTPSPQYLWEFPNPSDPNYLDILLKLGQSCSEPAIGRVKVGGKERWVAFIGGGFQTTGDEGRVFYVVDMKTGVPIKEFSKLEGMDKSLAAPSTAVDTNSDGFVDKVYIGDLKGQMWVFDVSNSDTTQWKGQILFKASGDHPIYYPPAVAFDKNGTPWIYFGTGDRENPNDKNSQERFYAVQDGGSVDLGEGDLKDVTSTPNSFNPVSEKGWYIKLANKGEKVLGRPAVFNRLVYFTTYTPETKDKDLCAVGGTSTEYIVEYLSGGGAFNVDDMNDILNPPKDFVYTRSQQIGSGAPSAPVISVNIKSKASVTIGTTSGKISSREAFSLTTNREILYWREVAP